MILPHVTASFCICDTRVKNPALAGEFQRAGGGGGGGGGYVILQESLCVRPRQIEPQENSFLKKRQR